VFWLLWLAIGVGTVSLIVFAWRAAMRRRGFKLVEKLSGERVVRYAVDVPVLDRGRRRRGTLVLTRKRLAGYSHNSRWVFVRGSKLPARPLAAEGDRLVVRPLGDGRDAPELHYLVDDAQAWLAEARKVLL
jgi:hypothetical protein